MRFLYGDSTPSPLATDFIDFLRKGTDCFVSMLQAEQRILKGVAHRRELENAADRDILRLRDLEAGVSRTIAAATAKDSPEAPVTRCSFMMSRAMSAAVAEVEAQVKAALAAEIQRVEEAAAKEGTRCKRALEELLLAHDLPASETELRLEHRAGAGHLARLHGTSPYGLTTVLELEMPAGSRFATPLRVSPTVVESLDVQVPKAGRKKGDKQGDARLTTEKLGRLFVTSCAFGPRGRQVSLRTEALDQGYDLATLEGDRIQALRVSSEVREEVELGARDAAAVKALIDALAAHAAELAGKRTALLEAKLDGEPIEDHRAPSRLVQRLLEVMTPTVHEIAARSRLPTELVLRRELEGGRREERFVRRAELAEKVAPLPASQRALFTVLGFGDVAGGASADHSGEELASDAILEEKSAR
jgi:hypothetical protein